MMKKTGGLILMMAALIAGGCAQQEAVSEDESLAAVRANIKAAQEEDLEAYLATIHPESPSYQQTKKLVRRLFENCDLSGELLELKLLAKTEDEARVEFVQKTRKLRGPEFQDNQVFGVHLLKKSDGRWKIMSTEIKKVEYLDPKEPEPASPRPADAEPREPEPEPAEPVAAEPPETAPLESAPEEEAPSEPAP